MTMVSPPKWLVLMISIISSISDGHARARIPISSKVTGFDKPKGTIKTIESYETGEVIDCVDIFKQPAFDHPLLKNHTIQIKPSSNPKANGEVDVEGALYQAWWKNGECPEGTIPILRPQNHTDHHFTRSKPHVKRPNSNDTIIFAPPGHEYADVSLIDGIYKGASAKINVWLPLVMTKEASFSEIWVTAGSLDSLNSVEAGWMVHTDFGGGLDARTFIYWTTDGYIKTGCFNLKCPGFVQTNKRIALGAVISPVSTYKGQQYEIAVNITKDDFTGWWWLHLGQEEVGYWPKELFTLLKGFATQISWGGEVYNSRKYGIHTGTQMGSGSFPSEGFGKAAFFRNLKMIDYKSIEGDPENLQPYVTRPECYDLKLNEDRSSSYGVNFFYGGPGYSPQCIN